ncbi:MAG: type II toxin-antitoxin system PemK/MazF family toxin [bacterium]|nr:type II toxin-antitoxin system PemK/MazF family toxin [bacterium]
MEKDFNRWNEKKMQLNDVPTRVFFHPRELWFAHLGVNVGFEQDGRGIESLRPILILRKFNNEVFWGIPLTTRWKEGNPYYARFPYSTFPEAKDAPLEWSVAILSQLRLIDGKRLRYKIGTVHAEEFDLIKDKIRQLLA